MRPLLLVLLCPLVMGAVPAAAQTASPGKHAGGDVEATLAKLDEKFGDWVVDPIDAVLFTDVAFWDNADGDVVDRCRETGLAAGGCREMVRRHDDRDARQSYCEAELGSTAQCNDALAGIDLPFIVVWLVAGALFFTFRFGFINLRAFRHALAVTVGRYDNPDDPGEVSHFQALSSALSATVGLGNIAGVAVAVGMGGPGAVLWMILGGFLGMSSKFTECTLGQLYREVDAKGQVSGGPMRYLYTGLAERGGQARKIFGVVLSIAFSLLCIGASFGGGNMFQSNQSYAQVSKVVPVLDSGLGAIAFGLILAFFVGIVIIGGIRRIATVASYIVPFMCAVYVLSGSFILIVHAAEVPTAFGHIVGQAFTPEAGFGGLAGVLIQGFRRSAFSNEAGIGSAAIAHSAAATGEPVREGIVALLEPFIDTIVVCTMTALVVVITGAYREPGEGVVMTSNAFASVIPWFPTVLSFAVVLFAFSTMISWSYYGERCWSFLFGARSSIVYRFMFCAFVFFGAILKLGSVLDFSDLMILGMAFPNVIGLVMLSGRAKRALDDYWGRYRSGNMPTRKEQLAAERGGGEGAGGG